MRTTLLVLGGSFLFGLGYLLGTAGGIQPASAAAQEAAAQPAGGDALSEDARTKIKAAADALKTAMEALQVEQRYMPATKGVNAFAILTGRCNALAELEAGQGVDPETYAALYAGLAVDELQEKIGFNSRGQLTFNGKVVMLVPKTRMKALYAQRAAITGEELPGAAAPATE